MRRLLLSAGLLLVTTPALATDATLHRNPNCGCCEQYARYLEKQGWEVDVVSENDLSSIKREAGVPESLASCHTMQVGDYVVEGHVPLAAIDKLLRETPDIDGIGLAGMPTGSPGMPGPKQGEFTVEAFDDQRTAPFMSL
ncbi:MULTISPECIES: DUF411 domain-containing protein [unclassified Modicisalibacter]|uniref:DUF411 domain-containing protein n=1 Tax=unclassified Modicisalibacter TaxID=2679913 RepID=UPI001CCF4B29|nr:MULTISPECIES: DUF411 domain-containing protein [unclassified Modicisalibacter]